MDGMVPYMPMVTHICSKALGAKIWQASTTRALYNRCKHAGRSHMASCMVIVPYVTNKTLTCRLTKFFEPWHNNRPR